MQSLSRIVSLAALGLAAALPQAAAAQQFPQKVITILVPFGPGGGTDQVARLIAPRISEAVGQPVIVENKPGGNGQVAASTLKLQQPDGHTVLAVSQGILATNPWVYPKLSYDPKKDFTPVTLLYSSTHVLLVPSASSAKSAADVIAMAKAKSGGLNFGSVGIGSGAHIAGELWKQAAKIEAVHIPHKGSADLIPNLIAGRVDYGFDGPSMAARLVQDGKLRALAVTDSKPSPSFPGVPTMAEAGFPGVELNSWFGIVTVAGTPKPVIVRLHAEFAKAISAPDVGERLAALGNQATPSKSPEDFAAMVAAETERHGKIVKAAGVKVE
jgi:tripartite-type tricarboxylate transporter receptor subunit TctC